MRFKSSRSKPIQVFAVSGVNTISFGIKASEEAKAGLLGFAVERFDPEADERYFMPSYKVFRSVIPNPLPDASLSTWEHPVQSFVWDDFTAKPDHEYEYFFYPLRGTPKNLDRSAKPVRIRVRTEPLFGKGKDIRHDVFFNRGVASSQAYRRRFGNLPPDKMDGDKAKDAEQWLMRDLLEAALRFIGNAKEGDTLLCCFYEFRFEPVAKALRDAIDRKVNVQLIIDAKVNEKRDKKGNVTEPSFPREDNLAMLKTARIPKKHVTLRQAKPANIQHNKFMVLVRGGRPKEVWTGSTNISLGGFSGQTNVGHWVREPEVAKQFKAYWELLKTDPGAVAGLERSEAIKANRLLWEAVGGLHETPTEYEQIPQGTTAVFSPRAGGAVLDMYVRLCATSKACSCITLAFGINESFKKELLDNTSRSNIIFMLLEKRDAANPRSSKPFVPLTARQNVYQAWGAYIKDPVYQWARETNASLLKLNHHVTYVHSKFLLMDPLGDDPLVVTGSANFSKASTNDNDENMLIVRGDRRVADIYFTEFNRLFNHYYFRSVTEATQGNGHGGDAAASLFLAERADDWLGKYAPGKLKAKRLRLFTEMEGAQTL
ncbi:MAG TPA: phospholipase D-like domain-containing protein [Pyrinomonadaceae bacterium]|nr:phospholipase D-like domain-containing protein [Pyrinomonadaceae bacterium]